MKNFWSVIFSSAPEIEDSLQRSKNRLLLIEAIRVMFSVVVIGITVIFQLRQPNFISPELVLPLYSMLAGSFLANTLYLYFWNISQLKILFATAFLFIMDTLFITGLIYYTDVSQSLFLFMYLVNIILCGFVFQRYGAFSLALLTSACFSLLLILAPGMEGPTLYFSLGINNLAFFSVAWLSGFLSEQLNFMGVAIAERDKDIKALQDLNELIIENIATGLMTVDKHHTLLHCNKAALEILGRKSRIVGMNLHEIHPDLENAILNFEDNNVNYRSGRFEIVYLNPRQERLLLGVSVSPIYDREKNFGGYVLIFQDLTQIKRLEKAVRRSEKLAAVGQLAAGIAHEIRNPLASISGSVQLMKARAVSENEDDARLMKITLKEIDRLNGLINDFLDFVRPDEERFDPIDANKLLKECLDMMKVNPNFQREMEWDIRLESDREIEGNRDKLKQVFLNLLINAYQAMEITEHPKLTVVSAFERGIVKICIQDNGSGIKPEILERLFEPFLTTKKGGTGLGLATVHKIIENHEAQIFVESEVGKGTEFVIEFTRLASGQNNPHNEMTTA